jgi:hypothetical protein
MDIIVIVILIYHPHNTLYSIMADTYSYVSYYFN